MKINVQFEMLRDKEKKKMQLEKGSTINDLLEKLDLRPNTVIVMNKGVSVPSDLKLDRDYKLGILEVTSGG